MVKSFCVVMLVLTWMFFTLLLMPPQHNYPQIFQAVTQVTHMPSFAYSGSFLEYRISLYDDGSGRIYPKMSNYKTREFVYAP
jgi:hypothetical protein